LAAPGIKALHTLSAYATCARLTLALAGPARLHRHQWQDRTRGYSAAKAACEQVWIDPVHQVAQPARARNPMVEFAEPPQEIE
jgi:hypothetical protein